MHRDRSASGLPGKSKKRKKEAHRYGIRVRFGVIISGDHPHLDETSPHIRILERKIEDLAADVVPVTEWTGQKGLDHVAHVDKRAREDRNVHIDWPFLLQDILRTRRLVIKAHICTERFTIRDLLV